MGMRDRFRVWSDDLPVLRPYSLADLIAAMGGVGGHSRRLGLSGSRWAMLCRHGALTGVEADRLAVAAGYHPAEIWGGLWAEDDETAMGLLDGRDALGEAS